MRTGFQAVGNLGTGVDMSKKDRDALVFQAVGSPSDNAVDIDANPFWKEEARKAAKQKDLKPVSFDEDSDA